MSKINTLSKTCVSCGLEKPLSAFLVMSGTKGTTYGNICASCRKTIPNKNKPHQKDTEESISGGSGFKIDSKARVKAELDKRQEFKRVDELYHEDRDKDATEQSVKIEKGQIIKKDEKKHRQAYLEKRSFLDKKTDRTPSQQQVTNAQIEQQLNVDNPLSNTRIGVEEKYKGETFNRFKAWLGKSSPIVQAAERASQKPSEKSTTKGKNEKEVLKDYINEAFKPGSKRR